MGADAAGKISRRAVVAGGVCCLPGAAGSAMASCNRNAAACAVRPPQLRGLRFADEGEIDFDVPDPKRHLFDRSNRDSFDRSFGQALLRIARFFDAQPPVRFYQEGRLKPGNALALRPNPSAPNGEVLMGLKLTEQHLGVGDYGDLVVLAIACHEFAHIKQFEEASTMTSLFARQPCRAYELHADFMAGMALHRFLSDVLSRPIGLQTIGRAWLELGSSDFNRPGTHGTSQERVAAIEAGYGFGQKQYGMTNIWQAMSGGVDYIRGSNLR